MPLSSYVCPVTKAALTAGPEGLAGGEGRRIPYLPSAYPDHPIPDFRSHHQIGDGAQLSLAMYGNDEVAANYRNYLDWLCGAFAEDEALLRRSLVAGLNLKEGERALITGCGLGHDFPAMLEAVGPSGEVYAQDLSPAMVLWSQNNLHQGDPVAFGQVFFSVGDAVTLPFADGFFDAAFHVGGINLFDDIKGAIAEMDRVVRPGGRVVFCDEGVAPWLKETEYGKIAITNNALWAADAPLPLLPERCLDVNVTWILGNCFYVVRFTVSDRGPVMNIDLPHKGRRGGTPRTRYFGQLEGVSAVTKDKVLAAAAAAGISVHDWLEEAITKAL